MTLGASEVAVILGVQRSHEDGEPYTSPLELWARLSGLVPRYDAADSPDAELGRWLEPAIGIRYATETRWAVLPGPELGEPGFEAEGIPWHARPDFLVPQPNRTLEVKAPRVLAEERWGPAGTDQVPAEYYVQVVAQVAVAHALWGVESGDLAAMARAPGWGSNRTWAVYTVHRDAELERRIVDQVRRWLDRHVVGCVPPEPDGSASASETLARIWRPASDRARTATPTEVERIYRYVQLGGAIRELKARRAEELQRLQLSMAATTVLQDQAGATLATWRTGRDGRRHFRPAIRLRDEDEDT